MQTAVPNVHFRLPDQLIRMPQRLIQATKASIARRRHAAAKE